MNKIKKAYIIDDDEIIVYLTDKIIKEESSVINIRKFDPLLLNPKVFLPLLLIIGYLIGYALFKAAKRRNNQ